MTFEEAVEQAGLGHAFQSGLQALGAYSQHVACTNPRLLRGSIDLDAACKADEPNANRWDYGIGLENAPSHRAVWVEIHNANSSHVSLILAKLSWLKHWLNAKAPALRRMTARYYWVGTGKVALRPGTPQALRIASAGISFVRSPLKL